MKVTLVSFISGLIFGSGLVIGEMTRPIRVLGFLNIFGDWDPTLFFVMGGAVFVHMICYPLITKRSEPILKSNWSIPSKSKITTQLILGSFIFGVGWGLAGYCPGPGITSLASFSVRPIIFVSCMFFGMFIFRLTSSKSK